MYMLNSQRRQLVSLVPPNYETLSFSTIATKHCYPANLKSQHWKQLEQVVVRNVVLILQMLLSESYGLLNALVDSVAVTEEDTVSKSLLYLFQNAGRGQEYMEMMVNRDLDSDSTKKSTFTAILILVTFNSHNL